ncbi:D-alanyl-D-alanine carboxypeptidase/D-alanyl-D-alanine-endopeptidase [Oricola indica]|jgi:D-alanyl-D-alanine carboxypeptidase/D-alanyl-D-alanine-endopeptidase (penicillin-binding protein 4)|uniref:D-alanyl-D-alanine carboxypeptidase/D-alanyl-D-alanine-endopeptidase n=1 Tax=Oricola indica TaxID=2872591 RepID=UPI001CC10FAE|nr:D-alanyl-D-alanine carboxypeptidase [Oricola indica]
MCHRLIAFVCIVLLAALPARADVKDTIAKQAPSGLVLVLDKDGNELIAQNTDEPFVPASVTKVVTAWLALEVLGADYRFETRFYMDDKRVLYVRGGGDPFLVSEELALIAPALLAATGSEPFSAVVLDGSYYPTDLVIPGIENTGESYDALNSALAVNFNTINAVRDGKTVRSAEEQTPITPLAISQFLARAPNGRSRISLAQENPEISVRYAGELLAAFIEKAGGAVDGEISIGAVPAGLEPIHVHRQSRPLSEILKLMLIGSNNYIANQIFLEIGADLLGGPVSLDKSLRVSRDILARHGLANSIHLEEGSGISRGNHFTARGLAKLLDLFAPHARLMRSTKAGSRYKTGTFSGVRTLAGFAKTSSHGDVRFVISLNSGPGKLRFHILQAIEQGL